MWVAPRTDVAGSARPSRTRNSARISLTLFRQQHDFCPKLGSGCPVSAGNVIIAAWVQQVDGSVLLYKPSFSATIFSTLKIAVELANAVSASYAMASNGLCR